MKPWTPEEAKTAMRLRDEGMPYPQLSQFLGRSIGSLASAINRHSAKGTGKSYGDTMHWRAKQLLSAGYSRADVIVWIGCSQDIADDAWLELYWEAVS